MLDLSIAIPAHNDTYLLLRLLRHIAVLGLAQEVIVVDDGSQPAMNEEQLREASGLTAKMFHLVRNETPLGPGRARNQALECITCSHLLFLDADDLPTRELRDLCHMLAQEKAFDFCIFHHHDSRMEQDKIWGMMEFDQTFWERAELAHRTLASVSRAAAHSLVQTANYPWNKIYRVDFLRKHLIRCAELYVHEDIALHWQCFLKARKILSSDVVGVVHFVNADASRLTNYIGEERLKVFETLSEIARTIKLRGHEDYSVAFYSFAIGLMKWVYGMVDPELHPRLITLSRDFLAEHLPDSLRHFLEQDSASDGHFPIRLSSLE
ncbi:glycosyltransferase family 2 protein [Rhodobacteraceae bacterium R_SAG6]|nr:glycosyltransferase family 2 protein [Rhodobacteraceae bacterium R_SAG6]